MDISPRRYLLFPAVLLCLFLLACGGDDSDSPPDTNGRQAEVPPATTTASAPPTTRAAGIGTATPAPTASSTQTPPPSDAEADSLLQRTFENMATLTSTEVEIVTNVTSGAQDLTLEQFMIVEASDGVPQRLYVRTTTLGLVNEIYFNAGAYFFREGGSAWTAVTPEEIGLSADAIKEIIPIPEFASGVERLPDVRDGSQTLAHLHFRIDGADLQSELTSLYSGALAGLLDNGGEYTRFEVDYFVLEDRLLLRRARTEVVFLFDGVETSAIADAHYRVLGGPVTFPEDLPDE